MDEAEDHRPVLSLDEAVLLNTDLLCVVRDTPSLRAKLRGVLADGSTDGPPLVALSLASYLIDTKLAVDRGLDTVQKMAAALGPYREEPDLISVRNDINKSILTDSLH